MDGRGVTGRGVRGALGSWTTLVVPLTAGDFGDGWGDFRRVVVPPVFVTPDAFNFTCGLDMAL